MMNKPSDRIDTTITHVEVTSGNERLSGDDVHGVGLVQVVLMDWLTGRDADEADVMAALAACWRGRELADDRSDDRGDRANDRGDERHGDDA